MLYQVAIQALEKAVVHLRNRDHIARATEISRAQEAVNELILSLDRSVKASFTPTLVSLYAYVQEQIVMGHAKQSEAALKQSISVLRTLLDGWSGVVQQEKQKERSEAAYAASIESKSETYEPAPSGYAQAYQEPEHQGRELVSRDWNC